MSLAFFDDTVKLYISSQGGEVVRDLDFCKIDRTTKSGLDKAVMYIPIYNVRDCSFISPDEWDEEEPSATGFTVRPGDRFSYHNNGRGGGTPLAQSPIFTVNKVNVNVRGSRRMRHVRAEGEREITI